MNANPHIHLDMLAELRERIFERLLFLTALGATIGILAANFVSGVPSNTALLLWFGLCGVCAAAYVLKRCSLRAAVYWFLVSLAFCFVLTAIHFATSSPLYLLALLVLVARFLVHILESLLVAFVSSLLLVVWADTAPLAPLLHVWLTWIVCALFFDGLLQILAVTTEYQKYAVHEMENARESRAVLAQRTKLLDEATQNLEYANNQLQHARRAAEEARRLKAQFAANVSHELRTPINLIVGFSEMIISAPEAYGVALPSVYWSDMNAVFRNARHLQSLINDVLDISQIEAGHMAIVKEEIPLGIVIREAADMLHEQIIAKGLQFHLLIPDDLPTMWLDRVRMRQVIINLLGNALRFTDSGSITLRAVRESEHVIIAIRDTGVGIPPSELSRVFEEFHQLDASLSRRSGGSGLGLTLSKHFVEMHHGQLWAESEGVPGKGSCFYLSLPFADSLLGTASLAGLPFALRDYQQCFVVYDDDPAIIQLFERYSLRHRALGTSTPEQVLDWVHAIQPAAIVVDAEHMHQSLPLQDVGQVLPVITCAMPSGRRTMQMLGVNDYLVKPVTADGLRRALHKLGRDIRDILIIDDDREIVRLFHRMLQAMPETYQVRKAYGGLEGLELMRLQPPDVVILDLLMPDLDGLSIVQQMRASEQLASIPIIVVSARGASEAIAPTSDGCLTIRKPDGFQPLELVHCVEALIDSFSPTTLPET